MLSLFSLKSVCVWGGGEEKEPNFLARSCKILQTRGFLGKNLGESLTKKFRNIQDSYQELQEFLHWDLCLCLIMKPFCYS